MGQLILFRGIQGLGAGALFPIALAVIGDLFTPQERGKYQGLFGAVFGIAFILGPLIGGFLTDNFSWHWIFYVNIPIGIVALFVIRRLLPTVKTAATPPGTSTSSAGRLHGRDRSFLLVGLTNKQSGDWTDPTVGGLILVGLVGRCCSSSSSRGRRSRSSRSTCSGTGRTRRRWSRPSSRPSGSSARSSSCRAGSSSSRASRPTDSGWPLLPLMVGLIFSSIVSGLIVSRTGRYKWLILGVDRRSWASRRCS